MTDLNYRATVVTHFENTHKFKTITIGAYIDMPLTVKEAALNALSIRLMVKATQTLSPMGLNRHLQELYGAYLGADIVKYGEFQSLQIKMTLPCDRHLPQPVFQQGLALFYSLFTEPVTQFIGFEQLFVLEKRNLLAAIEARKTDKATLVYEEAMAQVFQDQPLGISAYGSTQEIEGLTLDQVRGHIDHVLSRMPHTLMIMGHLNPQNALTTLHEQAGSIFKFEVCELNSESCAKVLTEKRTSYKATDMSPMDYRRILMPDEGMQLKANALYLLPQAFTTEEYYSAMLLSHILGGGATSILFEDIREKRGLCYSIYARADKFSGLVSIISGIHAQDLEEVERAIAHHIQLLAENQVDHLEQRLERSKKLLLNSYHTLTDSPSGFMNFIYTQKRIDLPVDLVDIRHSFTHISAQHLVSMAKELHPIALFALIPNALEAGHD